MKLDFQLVDSGWDRVLREARATDHSELRIICPFIKNSVAERLLHRSRPQLIQVITRFDLNGFSDSVSDLSALRLLLENGAEIRGVKNLHAKLYLFGKSRVIVTSANLTESGLSRNHEFGFVAADAMIVNECLRYFDTLWSQAGENLVEARMAEWEQRVTNHLARGARRTFGVGLRDEGVDIGIPTAPNELPAWVGDTGQAFVKFFGTGPYRVEHLKQILEEVRDSGCHWACTYPKGRRPRQVEDGAIMFMGRLVRNPKDIIIYGRAVGMRHVSGRDDATVAEKQLRSWKKDWPHYIRVHHAEFVAGTLANGISLGEMMHALKSDSFATTQRNAASRKGNVDPRKAYIRQPAVELSPQGMAWLNERLEAAFAQHGKLATSELEQLDWPTLPSQMKKDGR